MSLNSASPPTVILNPTLNILLEISRYNDFSDPSECLIRNNLAMASIGLLCNAYSRSNPNLDFSLSEEHAMMESISYIHKRYFEKITIEHLFQIAHMSRSSYIKKFKEICKMSPASYITKVRIDSASIMLLNTSLSVSEIAFKNGFYDASHFTKTFENIYGISQLRIEISVKNNKKSPSSRVAIFLLKYGYKSIKGTLSFFGSLINSRITQNLKKYFSDFLFKNVP